MCSWLALVGESARVAAATQVVSALVAALAFAVPVVVVGATGLRIEGQAAILRRVDDVGARTITIVATGTDAVIPAAAVDRIASLNGVAWVVGLGPVIDVRTRLQVGGAAPLRAIRAIRAPVAFGGGPGGTAVDGPGDGVAFVSDASARRAGLAGAYSVLDPGAVPVVGWFRASDPLKVLDAFILVPSRDDTMLLERMIIAVGDPGWVDLTAVNATALIGTDAAAAVSVERSLALLAAREAVRDEVGRQDRVLILAILAAAMALACVVIFAGTMGSRRDFGRRRALGATRGQLMLIVVLATLWPAVAGTAIGTVAGWVYLGSEFGHVADLRFPVSVGILTALALAVASALPAAHAATRDPLRVLRMP